MAKPSAAHAVAQVTESLMAQKVSRNEIAAALKAKAKELEAYGEPKASAKAKGTTTAKDDADKSGTAEAKTGE